MDDPVAMADREMSRALKDWHQSDGGEEAFAAVRWAIDRYARERELAQLADQYNVACRAMETHYEPLRRAAAAVRP